MLTRIEGLEVESMHKEERIKVLGKKNTITRGSASKQEGGKNWGGKMMEEEKMEVEREKGKTSIGKLCQTQPEKDWKMKRCSCEVGAGKGGGSGR